MKTTSRFLAGMLSLFACIAGLAAPPAQPQNVQQAWLGSESILLWDDVPGATSYNIYRADQTNTWSVVGSSPVPRFRDPAWQLLPSFYVVTAVNTDGEGAASELSTVSYVEGYTISVYEPYQWNGTLSATNGIIQWSTSDPNGGQGLIDWGLNATNFAWFDINTNYLVYQTFSLTNLSPKTFYFYRLTSITSNRAGVSYNGYFQTPDTNHPPVAFDLTYPWPISTNGMWILLRGYDSNDPQHALSFRIVSQPTNGTLSAFQLEWAWGENMIYYTPNRSARGYDHFQFVVNNGTWDSAPALVTLTNWINTPPLVTNGYVTTPEDTPIALTLPTFDAQGDPITFTIPPWATYRGSVTGQPPNMVFIPETNFNGTAYFSYLVTDGYQEVNGWFQIDVTPVNDKPVLMTNFFTSPATWEDTPVTISLWVYDVEGAWPYEYIVVTPPAHGTLGEPVWDNITYTPATNFYGVDSFTMVAREPDGTTSDPQTYWITVSPMNDMPVGVDQDVVVLEDGSVVITPTGTDVDSNPALFTFEVAWGGWPTNGWLEGTGTNFIYHPRPDFFGTDAFQFNVIDDWGYRSWDRPGTIRITVLPVGEAPVASTSYANAHQDAFVNAYFWVSDVDSDTLVCEVVNPPVNGTVTVNGTNFLYRPNAGFQGSDYFTYRAFDGEFYSSVTNVYVWVNGPNNPPDSTPQTISAVQNTAVTASLLMSDPDFDFLMVTLIDPPQHGTIEFSRYNFVEDVIVTYTPTNDFVGTDSFSYQPFDGVTNGNTTLVTINVALPNQAPVTYSTNLMTQRDVPLSFTLLVTDADGDALTYIVGSPAHGTLSGTAPNLTYTPSAGFMGADSFTFRANDGTVNGNTATVTITITRPNVAPTANSQSLTSAEDTSLSITLSGADSDGDALTFRILSSPSHGTLTGTAPNLTYRPATNYNGSDSFTFTVNDGIVDGNTATVSLTITPVNDAPILLNPTTVQTLPEEWVTAWNPLATDPDGDPITYRLVTPPSHGTYDITNHLYRAAKDYNGGDYFTWVANDGQVDSALGTFSITITPVNDAPVASNQTVTVDTEISTVIAPLVSDVDNASLTLTVLTQPLHGTVTVNGMTFSYQPVSGYAGSDSFTYRASDGSLNSGTATISISVTPINNAPVRTSPDRGFTISEDWYREFDTQASDADGDVLSYRIVTSPTHGTITKLTSNTWRYQPDWNWFGSDTLTWVANDGQMDSTIGTVWFNVTSQNDRPLAGYDSLTNAENTTFTVTLWSGDVDGDALTYIIVTAPTNGVLSGTGSNRIYMPNPNFVGGDSLTYKVNDGQLDSFPGTILFTVTNVNNAPVANALFVTTVEDTATNLTLTGSDADGDALVYSIVSAPTHGTLTGAAPNLTYTPATNYFGNDSFVFSISDGTTNSTATVGITVTPVNDLLLVDGLRRRIFDGVVNLWWNAVPDAVSYSVYRADEMNGVYGLLASGLSGTNYSDATALFQHSYHYYITTSDGTAESAPSNPVLARRDATGVITLDQQNWLILGTTARVHFCSSLVAGTEGLWEYGTSTNYDHALENTNLLGCQHFNLDPLTPQTTYYYRLTATDSNGNAVVYWNSFATKSPPVANAQNISIAEDSAPIVTLSGSSDYFVGGFALTYSIVSSTTHGMLTSIGPSSFRYLPATNYNGTDSFSFKVNNGELDSAPATVSITVTPVNDLPVAANITRTTTEDTVATIPASFIDVDGGPAMSAQIVSQPAHGSAGASGTNLLYLPATNYVGSDSFTYRVSDGYGVGNTATVFLTATNVEDSPIAFAQSVTTSEDVNKAITLVGVDPDGDAITFSIFTSPSHGTLTGTAPNVTYRPATNYNGSDSFTFRTYDGKSFSTPATVSITVTPVNDPPIASNILATVIEDTTTAIPVSFSDVDGGTVFTGPWIEIMSWPSHGDVIGFSGSNILYAPTANYYGPDSFTYRVSDSYAFGNTATVSINVTPVNDAPVASSKSLTLAEDTSVTFTVSGSDVDGDALAYEIVTAPTNGALSIAGTNYTYYPATNFFGNDSFTFRASDGMLWSAPATVSITVTSVNDAPIAFAQSVTLAEDGSRAIVLTGSDGDGETLAYSIVSSPSHGALSGTPPNVTYQPVPNYYGADSFTFQVTDGNSSSAPAVVSITVSPINDAPVVTNRNFAATEDMPLNFTLTGSDVDGDALTFRITSTPLHGTITGVSPEFTYTPDANYNGSDSFYYTANDGTWDGNTAAVIITIAPVNDAPSVTNQSIATMEDTSATFAPLASDIDGDAVTFTIFTAPTNGVAVVNGGNLVYTPNANYNGTDSFEYQAHDSKGGDTTARVFVTVQPVNDAPVASNGSRTLAEDTSAALTLSASDVDGDALTFSIVNAPAHGTLSGTGANVTYMPVANYNGGDSFTFRTTDPSGASSDALFSLTITPVNDRPVASNETVNVIEETPFWFVPAATDVDGDTIGFVIVSQPLHGTAVVTNGGILYTPATNYFGNDILYYSPTDAISTGAFVSVVFNIANVNDAPTANSRTATTAEDTAVNIALSGSDPDNDALIFTIVSSPSHGTLSGTGASRTYTPAANYNGSDTFTFLVNDGTTNSAVATVSITVTPVNDPPSLFSYATAIDEDTPITFTLTASDADNDPLTYTIVSNPSHGTLSGTGPTFTYTPSLNYTGVDSMTIRASDGIATSGNAYVTFTMRAVNDAPIANAQSVSVNEDTPVLITLAGSDVDGNLLMYTLRSNPAHGTISGAALNISSTNANLTYTPAANYNGPDSFTFSVHDGYTNSAIATVTISVAAVNDAPVANTQFVSVTYNMAQTITLTGSDLEGSALTYTVVSGPTNGALSGTAPNLTYTPNIGSAGADFFTFRVNDGSLNSATASVSLTTLNPTGIPAAPSSLSVTVPTATGTLILNWSCTATNEDGFKIERSLNGSSGWSQIATTGINILTFTNTGLSSNTRYYYRVRSYNRLGDSAYSNTANAKAR